ncbi:MAG: hypothetical protein HY860_03720 [Chlamydiales bacterium]|nr:hypothetical protein [Chlamydiales bacterium]
MGNEYKAAIIRSLITYHVSEYQEELLHYFSDSLQKQVIAAEPLSQSPISSHLSLSDFLSNIDISWLKPFFENKTKTDQGIYLSALPENLSSALAIEFQVSPSHSMKKQLASFFLLNVYDFLMDNNTPFPIDALPASPLNALVHFNILQMKQYVRVLSLFDVAAELKHIIHSSLLKEIEKEFSDAEKNLIRQFSKRTDLLKFPPLKLQNWTGNIEEFTNVLFQRGLNRLAKGLYGSSSSLIWYIKHKLPQNHAKTIDVFLTEIKDKKIHDILLKQLNECIDIIQSLPTGDIHE